MALLPWQSKAGGDEMNTFRPFDPNDDFRKIRDLSYLIRDLADAGKFLLHHDLNAEGCRPMAEAVVSAIWHLSSEQTNLVIQEEDRLRAEYDQRCRGKNCQCGKTQKGETK